MQPGEDVLVLAASSGVGTAAIQIAKMFQCRVIATAGGEAKLAKARELGADHVIDHYQQDISAEVKKITGKRGVDVVVEHVGTATWQKSLESLAPGRPPGHLRRHHRLRRASVDLRFLFSKQWSLLGSFMGTMGELHQVLQVRLPQAIEAGDRSRVSAGGNPRGARAAGEQGAVRQSRRNPMMAAVAVLMVCWVLWGLSVFFFTRRTTRSAPPSLVSVPPAWDFSWSPWGLGLLSSCACLWTPVYRPGGASRG